MANKSRLTFGDMLKGQWRSVRRGGGWNAFENLANAKQIRDERDAKSKALYPLAEKGEWYTKYRSDDGRVHVMLGPDGTPTKTYPHVHVIHDEPGGEIRLHITRASMPNTFGCYPRDRPRGRSRPDRGCSGCRGAQWPRTGP